ncbi:MAG: hypothetical protein AAFY88_26835, partial [Acidobacteriota bacterium]
MRLHGRDGQAAGDRHDEQGGEPVAATGGRWPYRARKFVGRHRWPVALAALLVVSIAGGLTVAAMQA